MWTYTLPHLAVVVALLALPSEAEADPVAPPAPSAAPSAELPRDSLPPIFISPGYLHAWVDGSSPASGNGGELSASFFLWPDVFGELGVFGQVEALSGDRGVSTRWAGGAQASVFGLGLEAGYATRGADSAHTATDGVQIAPFYSVLGVLTLAYRWTIAVGDGTHGSDHGFVLGLKLPIPLEGERAFDKLGPSSLRGPITFGN